MQQYRIDEAKAQLDHLVDAALRGETVLITDENQQIVQLLPVSAFRMPRKAGTARGHIHMADDFDAPLSDFAEYWE